MAEYVIIQGDDKHTKVILAGSSSNHVTSFYFTSEKLGINKHITSKEADGSWYITLSHTETAKMPEGTFTFDITAILDDGRVKTTIYNGLICVKKKVNAIG